MLTRSLRFPYARQTASTLGWLAESLVLVEAAGTLARAPRLSLVGRDPAASGREVELLSAETATDRRVAWSELVLRSLEPNVFLEPDFALPAAQHIVAARRPSFLCVTDRSSAGQAGELIGLAALHLPRAGAQGLVRAWCPPQVALGVPLLDRTRGGDALDLMLAWLAHEVPGVSALLLPCLPTAGPVMNLIRARAAAGNLPLLSLDRRARALLHGGSDGRALFAHRLSPKRLKEIRRQRRRLAEAGELAYVQSVAADVRGATERFLVLEAKGWKGVRGTALLNDPGLATFARSMTRLLAREGKCRIDSLEVDGMPVAMGIVLTSGDREFLWKIAYDERFSALSPGVQFIIDFTLRQSADSKVSNTDSCAIPDHPMIDRLWPDRLEIADVLLAPSPERADAFAAAARRERLRRGLRTFAKRAYHAAAGTHPS